MTVTTRQKSEESGSGTRELNDNQRHAAELMSLGYSQVHVARELGIRPQSISEWKSLPQFQQHLSQLRAEARAAFREAQAGQAQLAVETMNELLLKGPAELRARISLAIWSRGLDEGTPSAGSNATAVGAALLMALREAK